MLLADGQSVVWASRLLRHPLPERVAGIDLFEELLARATARPARSTYWAPDPRCSTRSSTDRRSGSPGCGWPEAATGTSPPTGERGRRRHRGERRRHALPGHVLAKKEIFLAAHGDRLGVPVLHGVGGSFDVLAGVTRRAPGAGSGWASSGRTASSKNLGASGDGTSRPTPSSSG